MIGNLSGTHDVLIDKCIVNISYEDVNGYVLQPAISDLKLTGESSLVEIPEIEPIRHR